MRVDRMVPSLEREDRAVVWTNRSRCAVAVRARRVKGSFAVNVDYGASRIRMRADVGDRAIDQRIRVGDESRFLRKSQQGARILVALAEEGCVDKRVDAPMDVAQ